MKCKACNAGFTPYHRTLPETGVRVLEDLCSVCRRGVYAPPKYTDSTPDLFLDTVRMYATKDKAE